MEDDDEPGFFELRPFELWCIEELGKATRQFRRQFLKIQYEFASNRFSSLLIKYSHPSLRIE